MTEEERLQFLEARDLFASAECQRLALLAEDNGDTVIEASSVYYIGGINSGDEEEFPAQEEEDTWLKAAEVGPDIDGEEPMVPTGLGALLEVCSRRRSGGLSGSI